MTMFEPSLFARRLVVLRDNTQVTDITFHRGLNVVTGENSAGKTTIVRFLAFGMGAENIEFNKTALLCTATLVEVEANGSIITLKRDVTDASMAPMSVFWGSLETALKASLSQWQTFPFRRSESKVSFSQVLFKALQLPELRGESGSNITMHQVLRLVYSDQETPGAELFRFERFDSAITRQAIGDYLLGIDDNELYDLQLRASALEKEDTALGSALKAVYTTLGRAGTNLSIEFIEPRIQEIAADVAGLQAKLEEQRKATNVRQGKATTEDEKNRKDLNALHSKLSFLKDKRLEVEKQILDAGLFIRELKERLASAKESHSAASYLGQVKFSICPCCLSNISARESVEGNCLLCNSTVDTTGPSSQLVRMQSELSLQLKESEAVYDELLTERASIDRDVSAMTDGLRSLEQQFKSSKTTWRSSIEIEVEGTLTRIGGLQQELKQLIDLRKLAQELDEQRQQRAAVAHELALLRESIARIRGAHRDRRADAYETVARQLGNLLKQDVPRQPEFIAPQNIVFDFGASRMTIDSQQQFSASSMVYLRHAFRLALLFASLEKAYFRFPRIAIIDGIEDGGMEPDRSFNFQELIARVSNSNTVEHQIILTTSTIATELDKPEYVVGRKFSHDNRSLAILT